MRTSAALESEKDTVAPSLSAAFGSEETVKREITALPGEAGGRQHDTHIFAIIPDGEGRIDLSGGKYQGTLDYAPVYTPDGKKVVFMDMPSMPGRTPAL